MLPVWPFRRSAIDVEKSVGIVAVAPHPSRLLRSFGRRKVRPASNEGSWEERQHASAGGVKMVIVVNSGIGMRPGKIASQAAHAALGLYQHACEGRRSPICLAWDSAGAKKVVLKAPTTSSIMALAAAARRLNLPFQVVRDAGRTQVAKGSVTAIAIGPSRASDVDKVTGSLKVY